MNEQNLPDLPQEIALMQKVLRNLVEQNEALKAENSALRALIAANDPTYSQSDSDVAENDTAYSTTNADTATNNGTYSQTNENITGSTDTYSTTDVHSASKDVSEGNVNVALGISNIKKGNVNEALGITKPAYLLPQRLDMNPHNINLLSNALLNMGLGNGKWDTCETTAKLIIHFYNGMPGEYKYLKRLTGYSDGGLGKILMMLRKKGYLMKSGYQQHAVAANGLKALQMAECK